MKALVPVLVACLAPFLAEAGPLSNAALAPHAQDLVILKGQSLVAFSSQRFLQAPYTVLYFGASWCPDCRHFSPSLVAAYDAQPQHGNKQFEVLLLSRDQDAAGMLKFMRTEKMNWPAVAFDKLADAKDLDRFYSGHGIPCLTVIDRRGTVVLQTKTDQDAGEVLRELETLLKKSRSAGPGSAPKP
jgi:thiol-disulfide isomerase/thioredoxin